MKSLPAIAIVRLHREGGSSYLARVLVGTGSPAMVTGYETFTFCHKARRWFRTPDDDPVETQQVHGWPPPGAPPKPEAEP